MADKRASPKNVMCNNCKRKSKKEKIYIQIGLKKCSKCKEIKKNNEFYKGFSRCKKCSDAISKNSTLKLKIKSVKYFENKCSDCEKTYHLNLFEFHHINNDRNGGIKLSTMFNRHYKWEKIENELKKCVMLCVNCHRKRHFDEKTFIYHPNKKEESFNDKIKICSRCKQSIPIECFAKKKENKYKNVCNECSAKILRYKKRKLKEIIVNNFGNICFDCKKTYNQEVYDFHHENGKKEFEISFMINRGKLKDLKNELEKCIMLCANCHRTRHIKY